MHPIWFGDWGFAMMLGMMLFWVLMIGACIVGLRWFLTPSEVIAAVCRRLLVIQRREKS
jgi:hypothetical protein